MLWKNLASPQTGLIYQVLHLFKFLEICIDDKLSFDPLYHEVLYPHDSNTLIAKMWRIYLDAIEDLPTNAPKL